MTSYAIFDKITGEWLESYCGDDACTWTSEEEPETLATFSTKEAAQTALAFISEAFRASGEEVDFEIVVVRHVKPRPYYERV